MNARDKIAAAVAYLKSRNVSASTGAPPVWRLLWRLGWYLPPPHFLGFVPTALLSGLSFGVLMGGVLLGPFLLMDTTPDEFATLLILGSGPFFGLTLAAWYKWTAVRLGLPPWADFGPDHDAPDETW